MRGLTDRPPMGLTDAQREQWEDIYDQCTRAGNRERAWDDEWSSHVANKLHQDTWTRSGRRRHLPAPGRLPQPGNMIALGFFLDANYYYPETGSILILDEKRRLPVCLWSEQLRAVLVFPKMRIPRAEVSSASLPALLRLYRKWHDGKDPKDGGSRIRFPDYKFDAVYPCVATSYRSDKFDAVNEYVDYIHHHDRGAGDGHGPLIYISRECIMIRGGKLRVTSGGLDG